MNANQMITGRYSLFFLVGYFASICLFFLNSSVKTPFYLSISSTIRQSPLVSLIASVPCIYIVGIIIDSIKDAIHKRLLKNSPYNSENLPEAVIDSLDMIAEDELNLEKGVSFDFKLSALKNILLPDYDIYKIQQKWLHDFLQNVMLMSLLSLFVVFCRFIAFSWDHMDWIIIISSISISIVSYSRLHDLKMSYTSIILGLVLSEFSSQLQKTEDIGIFFSKAAH